jgi:hypothetical protein
MRAKKAMWSSRAFIRLALLVAIVMGSGGSDVVAQALLDLCGCAGTPGLLPFNASDPTTYPPGTSGCTGPCDSGVITLPLPPDGVLRFSSFTVSGGSGGFFIRFAESSPNRTNTPVTILVAGDVVLRRTNGCCSDINISGGDGSHGGNGTAGIGGAGGPGGYRGGDGAAPGVNLATIGGAGQGPGGGQGASLTANAVGGTFLGVPELVPLVGGSGGGGGGNSGSTNVTCTGGGGGGGGGAILIAANGTLTMHNFDIFNDGGVGGSVGNGSCGARGGAGGSAGAIRLVANSFVHVGTARLFARGGGANFNAPGGTSGRLRLESVDPSAQTNISTDPTSVALRITGPGPISNPVAPIVRITAVNGNPVPNPPQGFRGSIDLTLPAPGVVSVDLATSGVPSGTTLEVRSKARIGADPVISTVPLTNCDSQGNCTATATFNLNAGASVIEARATFQVQ